MPKNKAITAPSSGGLKGFFQRAGSSFSAGGMIAKDYTYWLGLKGARIAFIFATTSIVVFMPLIFEISRETQVIIYTHTYTCIYHLYYFNFTYTFVFSSSSYNIYHLIVNRN